MINTREIEVEKGYRCPLCQDHEDESYFIWEGIIETPICDACSYELGYLFLTPPDEGIWFGFDLHSIETSILEKITGKSINDLQMSYLLKSLHYYRYPEKLDKKICYYSEKMDENEREIFMRQEQRQGIEEIRYRKKLIRKLIRLQDKIQAGSIYKEVLCGWRDARYINMEKHSK